MELNTKQQEALALAIERYNNKEQYTYIAGAAGTGKAQPNDTKIPTPQGFRLLGELRVGDYVYDRQGNPTKIIGVYPQGLKEVYQISFSDGRFSLCSPDHLWSYYNRRHLDRSPMVGTAKEILEKGLRDSSGYKFRISTNKAVHFQPQNYSIDPYVIGVFLGDGCCTEKLLTLSSENEEIPKEVAKLIGAKTAYKNSDINYNWHFTLPSPQKIEYDIEYHNTHQIRYRQNFHTKKVFKDFANELIQSSYKKRIPTIYMMGSVEQRLSLLQGLMDTDGSINSNDGNRYNVRFTSVNLDLIHDVQNVLWSLG